MATVDVARPRPGSRFKQWLLAGFFLAAGVGSIAAGAVTQWAARRLGSVERGRQAVLFGTAGLSLLSAPAVLIDDAGRLLTRITYLEAAPPSSVGNARRPAESGSGS